MKHDILGPTCSNIRTKGLPASPAGAVQVAADGQPPYSPHILQLPDACGKRAVHVTLLLWPEQVVLQGGCTGMEARRDVGCGRRVRAAAAAADSCMHACLGRADSMLAAGSTRAGLGLDQQAPIPPVAVLTVAKALSTFLHESQLSPTQPPMFSADAT